MKLAGLCPVLWADRFGFIVVMPRVETTLDYPMNPIAYREFVERGNYVIPAENKDDSFGYLDGQLVAIDYGN